MIDSASSWLDEIELSPERSPVVMGTRSLGDRPWLIVDERRDAELALKAELCRTRHDEVVAVDERSRAAGEAVLALLVEHGIEPVDAPTLHPLDRAGRSVQEDLCLLTRTGDGWHLAAASLCFPSRWRLADKIGRHVTAVHGPVPGYASRLADRVDHLFDRLGRRPVWRRNWFIHPDPDLFQPDRPVGGDPLVPAERVRDDLHVRSERQTLRSLALDEPWILFTIRIQQASVAQLVADPDRAERFVHHLAHAPAATLTHRGMVPDQVRELRRALAT